MPGCHSGSILGCHYQIFRDQRLIGAVFGDESKKGPAIYCIQKFGQVDNEVSKLTKKFNDIIIDAGGRDSEELRSSMLVADLVCIPL